jgi:UDP-N-acetylmuramoyl-tripeptide--D-alanyl-D-alanine ligase
MPGGAAILPADVPTIDILVQAALAKGATIVGFGETAEAFRLTALEMHHDVTVIQARLRGVPAVLRLNTLGRHFAVNAMGVLAAVEALSGDPTRAAVDLFRWQPPAGRGRREMISLDPADTNAYFELIDDAYNANPASMAAALEVLAASDPQEQIGRGPRRVAILADMLELGQEEERSHAQLAVNNHLLTVDVVHCVGPRMRACYDALPTALRGRWVPEAQELASGLGELIAPGDRVLVKGSLGSKVSMIVDLIRNLGHRSQP